LLFGFTLTKFLSSTQQTLFRNPVIDKNGYSTGSVLIVPANGNGDIGLLNKKGYFEKLWSIGKPVFYGELFDNNKILLVHIVKNQTTLPTNTGLIAIYNERGYLETSFEDASLHHDIAIKSYPKIFALSRRIQKIEHKGENIRIIDQSIIEIDLNKKKITKKIDLLDYFPLPDQLPKQILHKNMFDIFHGNGLDYIKENPVNGNPAILITMRKLYKGSLALIDLKTDQLLWTSPKGFFLYPHDGKFTKDKTVTVFDNGDTSNIYKKQSRVVEMDITTNKIIWEYDGTVKSRMYKQYFQWQMFSPWVSGAQKTKKGYLIVSGMQGRIFEVSKDKKIVWDLPGAASFSHTIWGTVAIPLFKARQYEENQLN